MNYADIKLDTLVDQEAKGCEEPGTGYVHRKLVVAAVEQRLLTEGIPIEAQVELIHRVAEYEVDRYFNRRKPKITAQQSLYCPDVWLPLGDGKRVRMCNAGTADLATYLRGVRKNEERIRERSIQAAEYVDSRISALGAHPGRRLHWVEVNLFGYQQQEADPDEYLSGDEWEAA